MKTILSKRAEEVNCCECGCTVTREGGDYFFENEVCSTYCEDIYMGYIERP